MGLSPLKVRQTLELLKGNRKTMGYTHYFPQKRSFTDEEWAAVTTAARQIIAATAIPLAYEFNKADTPPLIDGDVIRFNGIGEKGHETFCVHRSLDELAKGWDYYATQLKERGYIFVFCKTAYKPYDAVVTAMLSAINHLAPGALDIGSDGEPREWQAGVTLANKALKSGGAIKCPELTEG